jgi:hypothetical protein
LRLNDNGTLSIYPGTNGAATGAPITTIGSPSTTLKELDLTDIDYDLGQGVISNEAPVAGTSLTHQNKTNTPQTTSVTLSLTHSDTQMFTWNLSQAVSLMVESKTTTGVPGINSEFTIGITETTTVSKGESTTSGEALTFTATDQLETPAQSTYEAQIVAFKGMETVPYTFTGTAIFENGHSGPVSGSGVFSGVSTGGFEVETTCVESPTHCAGVAPIFTPIPLTPVPEPATWAMILAGFLGLGWEGFRRSLRLRSADGSC